MVIAGFPTITSMFVYTIQRPRQHFYVPIKKAIALSTTHTTPPRPPAKYKFPNQYRQIPFGTLEIIGRRDHFNLWVYI